MRLKTAAAAIAVAHRNNWNQLQNVFSKKDTFKQYTFKKDTFKNILSKNILKKNPVKKVHFPKKN